MAQIAIANKICHCLDSAQLHGSGNAVTDAEIRLVVGNGNAWVLQCRHLRFSPFGYQHISPHFGAVDGLFHFYHGVGLQGDVYGVIQ